MFPKAINDYVSCFSVLPLFFITANLSRVGVSELMGLSNLSLSLFCSLLCQSYSLRGPNCCNERVAWICW